MHASRQRGPTRTGTAGARPSMTSHYTASIWSGGPSGVARRSACTAAASWPLRRAPSSASRVATRARAATSL
eukprot:3301446-Pyramimonas_sp.AAC.1